MAIRRKKSTLKVDRLSTLPESLLITILTILPLKTAIVTSILSHHWHHLWTHLTHIISPTIGLPPTTVKHIFSQLASPKLHSLEVSTLDDLHVGVEVKPMSSFLVPWITHICLRKPDIINISTGENVYDVPTCYLPHRLLACESLVDLRLHGFFEFQSRINYINLPNLKKLDLFFIDSYRPLMSTLFKSCPLLEDLRLFLLLWENDQIFDISAPKLKRLFIEIDSSSFTNHRFLINAPMLEEFDIHWYLVFFEFVTSPSIGLQQVRIVQERFQGSDKDYLSKIEGLFRGICYAESIVLRNWDVPMLSLLSKLDAIFLPVFCNLRYLIIDLSEKDRLWKDQFPRLPLCLLGNLKRVEVNNMMGSELDIRMLKHILCNAPRLLQLHVSVCYHECDDVEKDPLRKEHDFCKRLFMLSKISLRCRIQFSGDAITAASDDFIDDVLSCQLKIDMHHLK